MSFFERKTHYSEDLLVNNPLYLTAFIAFLFLIGLFVVRKSAGAQAKLTFEQTNILRGLAILVIIIHHVSLRTADPNGLIAFYNLGHFGVGIFLALSGYGLAESYKKKQVAHYFENKLLKIYFPFVFTVLLFILLNFTIGSHNLRLADLPFFVVGLTIFDGSYWYLQYLFFLYLAFWAIFRTSFSDNQKCALLGGLSLLVVFIPDFALSARSNSLAFFAGVLLSLKQTQIIAAFQKRGVGYGMLLLLLGTAFHSLMLMAKQDIVLSRRIGFLIWTPLIQFIIWKYSTLKGAEKWGLAIFALIGSAYLSLSSQITLVFQSISALAFAVTLILSIYLFYQKWTSIVFEYLGKISFELYLLHSAFLIEYDYILHRYPLEISFPLYVLAIILLAAAYHTLLSMLTYRLGALPFFKKRY